MLSRCLSVGLVVLSLARSVAAQGYPTPIGADFVTRNFTFQSGETLPEVKIHYRTVGTPRKNSEDYDPSKRLEEITAPVLAINSADDFVNPPELPMMQELIKKVKRGRFVLIPISDQTRGHGTHSLPQVWGAELGKFLAETERF